MQTSQPLGFVVEQTSNPRHIVGLVQRRQRFYRERAHGWVFVGEQLAQRGGGCGLRPTGQGGYRFAPQQGLVVKPRRVLSRPRAQLHVTGDIASRWEFCADASCASSARCGFRTLAWLDSLPFFASSRVALAALSRCSRTDLPRGVTLGR